MKWNRAIFHGTIIASFLASLGNIAHRYSNGSEVTSPGMYRLDIYTRARHYQLSRDDDGYASAILLA